MSETPTAGSAVPRRRAARTGHRPDRAGVAALVLGLVAVVLVSGIAMTSPPEVDAPGVSRVALDDLTHVCLPDPSGEGFSGGTDVTTLAAASGDLGDDGSVTASSVGTQGETRVPTARGAVQPVDGDAADALRVVATGDAAAGRLTYRTDTDPAAGSLAVQECLAPRSSWWFTGAGAGLDHRSLVVLANVDEGPAVVDLTVLGPDGVVDSVGTRGMTIAPGEVRTVDLVEVAPQSDELAVHVETSRGRVAAAVSDSFATSPGASPGREWVPAQDQPARRFQLGPLPRKAGARTLVLANPTGREALVEVGVAGVGGTFVPTDAAPVSVPPGTVVATDVTEAVGEDASALTLSSHVPVTATLRSSAPGRSGGDVGYAQVLSRLVGPSLAPVLPGGVLHLTGGPDGARVSVAALDESGDEVASAELALEPGATRAWVPPVGAAYVVVRTGRGSATGGVVSSRDSGVSQVGLRPAAVTLTRPVVLPVVRPRVGAPQPAGTGD